MDIQQIGLLSTEDLDAGRAERSRRPLQLAASFLFRADFRFNNTLKTRPQVARLIPDASP